MTQPTSHTDIPFLAPRPGLPRRAFLGALLAGVGAGGLVALGLVGSARATQADAFRFSRGTQFAPGESDRLLAWLLETVDTPRTALRIIGHTGTAGDQEANRALSETRAQEARTLALRAGWTPDRILFSGGVGGGQPLPRDASENDREYQSRLARVHLETVYLP